MGGPQRGVVLIDEGLEDAFDVRLDGRSIRRTIILGECGLGKEQSTEGKGYEQ